MTDVASEIGRLKEMSRHDLLIEWQRFYRFEAPRYASPDFLVRGVAYKLQERAHGALKQSAKRALRTLASDPDGDDRPMPRLRLSTGIKLVREWHGRIHTVLVVEEGFDYEGQRYRSLSQIAARITGAHWSGPRFFGLKTRKNVKQREALDVAA